jgi:hypothetical protein
VELEVGGREAADVARLAGGFEFRERVLELRLDGRVGAGVDLESGAGLEHSRISKISRMSCSESWVT